MKRWWEQFLGVPWKGSPEPPRSFNCGELVRWIYRLRYGVELAPIPVPDARSLRDSVKAMDPRFFSLVPADGIREGYICFLRRQFLMDHCGIAVMTSDGLRVLHCSQQGGTQTDSLLDLRAQGWSDISWWRHPEAQYG